MLPTKWKSGYHDVGGRRTSRVVGEWARSTTIARGHIFTAPKLSTGNLHCQRGYPVDFMKLHGSSTVYGNFWTTKFCKKSTTEEKEEGKGIPYGSIKSQH